MNKSFFKKKSHYITLKRLAINLNNPRRVASEIAAPTIHLDLARPSAPSAPSLMLIHNCSDKSPT